MMEWISVNDRLPEAGVTVLICGEGLYTNAAHIWAGAWHCDGLIDEVVTHWMSLPKPAS